MAKKTVKDSKIGKATAKKAKVRSADLPLFCIYLHHFQGGRLYRQYEIADRQTAVYDSGSSDQSVQATISRAIENALFNNLPPHYCGGDEIMHMRRKSLFVFAVESNSTLTQNGDIIFQSYKGNDGSHTFESPKYFYAKLGGKGFYVAYCLNFMKSTSNVDLGDLEWERFLIQLPYQKRGKRVIRAPGTGGTNMGPPLGPPDRKSGKR